MASHIADHLVTEDMLKHFADAPSHTGGCWKPPKVAARKASHSLDCHLAGCELTVLAGQCHETIGIIQEVVDAPAVPANANPGVAEAPCSINHVPEHWDLGIIIPIGFALDVVQRNAS